MYIPPEPKFLNHYPAYGFRLHVALLLVSMQRPKRLAQRQMNTDNTLTRQGR